MPPARDAAPEANPDFPDTPAPPPRLHDRLYLDGQAQFFKSEPPPAAGSLEPTRRWAGERLDEPLDAAAMSRNAGVSPRTFARRFREETGTTPLQWLLGKRVLEARRLLEETDLPVETIAWRVGFGTAASLRDHFRRATATALSTQGRSLSESSSRSSGT